MKIKIESQKTLVIDEISSLQEVNKRIKLIEKAIDIKYTKIQFKGIFTDQNSEYCYFDGMYYSPIKITNNYILANVDGIREKIFIPEGKTISFYLTAF